MGAVTRDEFDRLVERVNRIERTLTATVEMTATEVVGLRTYLDEKFAAVDQKFTEGDAQFDFVYRRFDVVEQRLDHQDAMIDALGSEIEVDLDRHDRKLDAILEHLGVEPPAAG
ncbi:MAG TPA: hypothetical protein VK906_13720 [Egicoccus sp.]|jgi:uncharacterized coiled-coil protein SlyX|nr:hypothetical protein [Egicoccus sp.]HSK24239.1 hypothetical protein [Egicoccus sp.]